MDMFNIDAQFMLMMNLLHMIYNKDLIFNSQPESPSLEYGFIKNIS